MSKGKDQRLLSSFVYLNITQFFGALNDNIFKFLVVFLLINIQGEGSATAVNVIAGLAYVLPFLIFSIPAGTFADRHSKRNITVFTKFLEIVVMSLGVIAFYYKSIWGSYAILFLMATQSAIFGPSKYGIVPELVPRKDISRANGLLTAFTVLAIIFGTTLATALTQVTHRNFVLTSSFCVIIAFLGTAASLGIGYTRPSGSKRKLSVRVVTEVIRVMIRSRTENYLFAAIMGSSYFYLVGAFIQLNIIPFAIQSLHLTEVEGGYLFLVAALGICLGSFVAGRISGDYVELGLSLISGLGIFVMMIGLYLFQHSLILVILTLFFLGIAGGIFLVPFDAYIQVASLDDERGENVAASGFLSFIGVLIATTLLALFGLVLGLSAAAGFLWMAILTFLVTIVFTVRMSDTFIRIGSRVFFRIAQHDKIERASLLGKQRPSLVICDIKHWWVGWIVMLTLHQRYMRFLIERPKRLGPLTRLLAWIGDVNFYTDLPDDRSRHLADRWLKRGYSVSIIPSPTTYAENHQAFLDAAQALRENRKANFLFAHLKNPEPPRLFHLDPSGEISLQD